MKAITDMMMTRPMMSVMTTSMTTPLPLPLRMVVMVLPMMLIIVVTTTMITMVRFGNLVSSGCISDNLAFRFRSAQKDLSAAP